MTRAELQIDLDFHKSAKEKLQAAYIAIADGGVQSYSIGSRTVTKHDLPKLREEISEHNKAIGELQSLLSGQSRRKAVGIVIRDW